MIDWTQMWGRDGGMPISVQTIASQEYSVRESGSNNTAGLWTVTQTDGVSPQHHLDSGKD